MLQDYTLADGTPIEGVAASLSLPNSKDWQTAGIGHIFTLDGAKYEVINIEDESPMGKVTIKLYEQTWSFKEGAVGRIGEHKVMFSNIMLQDYTLADGTPKEGVAASLSLPNSKEWQTAGIGHIFTLDGAKYEVISIEDESPFGKVTIKLYEPTWSFKEGTVGRIGEHKVMFSNIMLQDYTLADGTPKEGVAASLSLPNSKEWQTAGVGHVFTLDGVMYEVVSVEDKSPFGQVVVKIHVKTWSFKEGAVGRIGEHKVMFSNIMLQDYTLADGTAKEGVAASLSLPNSKEWQTAGIGHIFTLDGAKYEVISIEDESPFGRVVVVENNN
jgi:uncharacterized protein YaiE (UPF0345 family)